MSIRPLTKELQAKAEEELNETSSRIQNELDELKVWLNKTPHLKVRQDDQFLISFLRGCKFSLERAKAKLDAYYTIRQAMPEVFADRKITSDMIKCLKSGGLVPLPQTDGSTGPRLVIYRTAYDADKVDFIHLVKVYFTLMDIMQMEDDNLIVSGVSFISDLKQSKLGHFVRFTPTFMKKIMTNIQEGSPIRIKSVHYVNMPGFFVATFNMLKGFFSEKLRSRIKVHDNESQLYETIPIKIMPKEYGGGAGTIDEILDVWVKKFQQYEKYFEEEEKYGTNEKLRPGKPKDAESLFGLDGSFRQLEIF